MHSKPQLAHRYLKTTVEDDSRRDRGWGNCVLTRPLFGKLSCYYPVRRGRKTSSVVELLHNGRHESDQSMLGWTTHLGSLAVVDELQGFPEPSPQRPARGSTWTARVPGDLEDARPISLSTVRTGNNFSCMTNDYENGDWGDASSVWDEQSVQGRAGGWGLR